MQEFPYPKDHTLEAAAWSNGEFWVLTHSPYNGSTNDYAVTGQSGASAVYKAVRPMYYHDHLEIVEHPDHPGPSLLHVADGGSELLEVRSGRHVKPMKWPQPVPTETSWRSRQEWWQRYVGPITVSSRRQRAVCNDRGVVMTGAGAIHHGELVMGPSAYAAVKGVCGLDKGAVVMYERGGSHRVLKLPRQSHPTHLVLAPDGLTVLAACQKTAFVLDFDPGG